VTLAACTTLTPMLSRTARVGVVALCAAGLIGLLATGSAAAKGPRARASVIGGTPANLQDWGFTAAVLTPTTLCTGTVLSPTKVLTTAHCVGNPLTMVVRTNSTSAFAGGEAHGVASAAIAPGWTRGFESDLSVLTLSSPTSAPPIQLGDAAEDAAYTQPGAPLAVAGFGNRNPLIVGKQKIGFLTATDVSARSCPLPPWAICDAGGKAGKAFRRLHRRVRHRRVQKVICSGDSGGPLVARTPQGPRLVGIAEASSSPPKRNPFFFVLCGLKGFPSLHTRTFSYMDFILGALGP
jgi:secreted trypsin-like serine protease